MIPPIPKEKLPRWVQDLLGEHRVMTPPQQFEVGDRVFCVLYGEEDWYVLRVDNEGGSMSCGRRWNEKHQKYDSLCGSSTSYFVKYP